MLYMLRSQFLRWLVFSWSLAGSQCRTGGVVIADRKFAPRPGAPVIAVEGACLQVFARAPQRNDCAWRCAVDHSSRSTEVLKRLWTIREDHLRASDPPQAQLGVGNPACQGQKLGSRFCANNRSRERLNLLVRARLIVCPRRQAVTQCIKARRGFARLGARSSASRRVGAVGPYSSIVDDHRFTPGRCASDQQPLPSDAPGQPRYRARPTATHGIPLRQSPR